MSDDIKDGIHLGLPTKAYHAIDAASHSRLEDLRRSPAYCRFRIDNPDTSESDDTLRGQALHCLLLEPDCFASRYALKDYDGRTKEGKARKAEIEATGLACLPAEVWDAAHRSADAIRKDPVAGPLLAACPTREATVLWRAGGVRIKGRPDAYGDDDIIDIKSTRDAMEDDFPRFLHGRGVDRQLALYQSGLWACDEGGVGDLTYRDAHVIACMPDQPHEVVVYRVPSLMIEEACEVNDALLSTYARCMATGAWAGGPGTEVEAKRPGWAAFNNNAEVTL